MTKDTERTAIRGAELKRIRVQIEAEVRAALAQEAQAVPSKLDAAIEWINSRDHGDNCFVSNHYSGDPGDRCNCGKDAVLSYLETEAPQSVPAQPVAWDKFPGYLIDKCEGVTITEEGLQSALSAMLKDPQYAPPATEQDVPRALDNGLGHIASGMTLRNYFAAKAMQGICAHSDTWGLQIQEIANKSYVIADAMIRAAGAK